MRLMTGSNSPYSARMARKGGFSRPSLLLSLIFFWTPELELRLELWSSAGKNVKTLLLGMTDLTLSKDVCLLPRLEASIILLGRRTVDILIGIGLTGLTGLCVMLLSMIPDWAMASMRGSTILLELEMLEIWRVGENWATAINRRTD